MKVSKVIEVMDLLRKNHGDFEVFIMEGVVGKPLRMIALAPASDPEGKRIAYLISEA